MAKRKKNRKAVLVTSCILAAMIVAGSTFAWFTSKDEVTNRLTANADYGVSIAEDFTPPENLLPGQVVNKDVGVVNTGNIDALVRVHLEGAVNVLKEQPVANEQSLKYTAEVTTSTPALSSYALPEGVTISNTTDENLIALGLTKKATISNDEVYFRTLSTVERANPALSSTTNNTTALDDEKYSEVKSVQAGGYLAYATGTFKFTPENAGYTYIASDGTTTNTQTTPTELASGSIKNTWNTGVGLEIDADTFVPTSSGLFVFRRDVEEADTGTYYEYSGYYAEVTGSDVTYYALHYLPNEGGTTYHSDYVIYSTKTPETNGTALTVTYETANNIKTPVVSVLPTQVKLFSAAYTRTTGLVGSYSSTTPGTVTFTKDTGNDKIEVAANLANIGTGAEQWTAITEASDPKHTYFYYNNDVEEGDTTSKLVDSVKLADDTKKSAYLAMDFDLNVVLDTVQVTVDETGKEDIAAAKSSWATINKNQTKAAYDTSSNEIKSITWSTSDT